MTRTKTFGELVPGDVLQGPDGTAITTTRVYDEHLPKRMFELTLDDGRTVQAGDTHLWYVVLEDDWALLAGRKKAVRKGIKKLPASMKSLLNELARADGIVELSYSGLLNSLGVDHESEFGGQIERVLEAIGPIVEETHESRDLLSDELVDTGMVAIYDASMAARQLLSLSGDRYWKKKSPALPGRVVDTLELLRLSETEEVHLPTI